MSEIKREVPVSQKYVNPVLGGAGEVKSKVKHLLETEEPGTQLTPETFHILPHTTVQERWSKSSLCANINYSSLRNLERVENEEKNNGSENIYLQTTERKLKCEFNCKQ